MTPAKEIYNQIRHDPRFEPSDFFVGYDSRFDGLRESTLEGFGQSEIPWHRVQYIRDSSGIRWDRRTKLDSINHSGEPNAIQGIQAVAARTIKKEKTMKPKELLALGIPQSALALTAQLLKTHPEKQTMLTELRALVANPEAYTGHFLPLVAELSKPVGLLARDQPVPYKIWGTGLDAGSLEQMKNAARLPIAVRGALMPDAHQGYGLPIGGVLATSGAIIPYAVGVDIACRMKLSILDIPVSKAFSRHFEALKQALESETRFGMGAAFQRPLEHEVLDADWGTTRVTKDVFAKARNQLGTSGSGNHFVEFGVVTLAKPDLGLEAQEYLALLSHSGSRGAGAAVANHYSNLAMKLRPELPKELKHLAWLEMESEAGLEYWAAMNLMGEYASANHAMIHKKIIKAIGASVLFSLENHHNFCLPGNSVIPTPCGPKLMAQINIGDIVYTLSETEGLITTRVTNHWQSGSKPICTIRTSSRQLKASPDHPVLIVMIHDEVHPTRSWNKKHRGELVWKMAGELQVGDVIVCAEHYYANNKSIGLGRARVIGAMLGDGWVRHEPTLQGYTVGLAIGDKSHQHTHRYKQLLESELPWANWRISSKGAFGLTCSSVKVWGTLKEWGLHDYSLKKRIPKYVFSLPIVEKLEVLAGYVDSDGSISKNPKSHGRITLATTNLDLLIDMRELAIGCGFQITPIISSHIRSNFGNTTVHRCRIAADSAALLDIWHDEKSKNQYKSQRQRSKGLQPSKIGYLPLPSNFFAQRILKVSTSILEEPVYDLTVEHNSHSFISDGIVVHNCWLETHTIDGSPREVYVHRKGATPAGAGVLGMIPGSMATPGFVVRGLGNPDSLHSASHGAGRAMSRTKAKEQFNWKMIRPQLEAAGVTVLSAGIDENPLAYKNIESVMSAQTDLVKVIARFDPRIVKMADDGTSED